MNIRSFYLIAIVILSLGLLYEWNSEQRSLSIKKHLDSGFTLAYEDDAKFAKLENEELSLVISVANGSIVEARLKKYPVENVLGSLGFRVFGSSSASSFQYYFKSGFTGTAPTFSVLERGDAYVTLKDPVLNITKTVSLTKTPYEISIYDSSPNGINGKSYASLYRSSGRALDLKRGALEGGMMNNSSYEGVAISSEQDPYSTSRLGAVEEPVQVLSRSGWVAFVQKYFFAAIIGSNDYIYNYYALPNESGLYRMGYTVEGSSTSNIVYDHEHRLFIGPKIRKDLMTRAENLELAIDMGWFWFLAQPMVFVMDFINNYVNSWGLTIVIFTILIKLVFWPVTAKSFKSMAALRKITPELNEIKERYKNDRQSAGTETMRLMRKHGANPLGGCLPLLVQMPFFIGFFFALREMVELRYSSLGFWADLSAPDPYFVLPALFGLLMLLTQRLNPQPAGMDPTQAQIMRYMPVMFSVFFLFFPAALCLYTVVNTGVQLAQQAYLYRQYDALSSGHGPGSF